MADLEDVMAQVAALVAGIVYPNGSAGVTAPCTKIYPGWPQASQLSQDMDAGSANVSVYPLGTDKNLTRYPRAWQDIAYAPKSLAVAVSGNVITLSGMPATPLNIGVLVTPATGRPVSVAYAVQANDTLATAATALAALINPICRASSSGAVITVTGGGIIRTKVGGIGTQMRELKRQMQDIAITIWAPTPDARKALATQLDAALAAIDYITLPDTQKARWYYHRTILTDSLEQSKVYRRDLVYNCEYATTDTQGASEITFLEANVNGIGEGYPDRYVAPTIQTVIP